MSITKSSFGRMFSNGWIRSAIVALGATFPFHAVAQTALAADSTIVFPVVALTSTFTSEVTLENPNDGAITVALAYYDANNTAVPGSKTCSDIVLPGHSEAQVNIATQCALGAGSHFGLLIAADEAGTNPFFGYSRVQNNAGHGFSIEGFPGRNFSDQTGHVAALKRVAAAPTYQTNCFVASLAGAFDYELRLFDGATGTQIGTTIAGSLGAFQEVRYLDVFSAASAAAGDYLNVRAEFSRTSGGSQSMIGFCTVQDNDSFGADFRIAKSATQPTLDVQFAPINGLTVAIPGGASDYVFAGPTASISLSASGPVSASATASLGVLLGGPLHVSVNVCYQDQSGPGPIIALGAPVGVDVTTLVTFFAASGTLTLPAGSYNVGYCVLNATAGLLPALGVSAGVVAYTP